MPSLSFVLVEPGKRATPATKHQERVDIHSHAQKVTQKRKRDQRLLDQAKRTNGAIVLATKPQSTKSLIQKVNGRHGIEVLAQAIKHDVKAYPYGLPTPSPEPQFDRPLTSYSAWTDDHKYGLSMFQHVTIIDINETNTNMAFWNQVIPAYGETWKCVRDIVSAVASGNEAIQNRDDKLFLTALDLHLKAIASLRRDLTKLPLSAQVACCLLFEAFSVLRCDFASAGKQIDTAKMLTKNVPVDLYLEDDKLGIVCDALTRMSRAPAWSLWNPANFLKYEGLRFAEPSLFFELEPVDISQGTLPGLVESIQRFSRQASGRIRRNLSELAHIEPDSRFVKDVLSEFQAWWRLFADFMSTDPPREDRETIQQAEIGWRFTYITFCAGVVASGDSACDDPKYVSHFHRICDLTEQRFRETSDYARHSTIKAFLQILVPSLWLVVLMCRDPPIRARAITVLKSRDYQESDFNSIVTGQLADFIIQLETRGRELQFAHEIPAADRISVEDLKYSAERQEVVLSYRFTDRLRADEPLLVERIPWATGGDDKKLGSAFDALSQTCTLYRKVRPSAAPLGFLKPMYYAGQLVPVSVDHG